MKKNIISLICVFSIFASLFTFNAEAAARKPFKKHTLPGYIVGADFDDGDEGVTYSPLSVAKTGNYNYRPGYNLNFWAGGGEGQKTNVGMSFNNKEWLTYTVEVMEAGEYEAIADYATPSGATKFNLYVDDVLVLSPYLDQTGGFTVRSEMSLGTFKITAGTHILKFEIASGGMTFDGVNFVNTASKSGALNKTEGYYRYTELPAIIEAEEYDLGSGGCYSKDSKNDGKKFRKDDPMNIYEQKSDKAYYVRYEADEYSVYTFNVVKSGVYDLHANALLEGKGEFYIDNGLKPVLADIKTDGGKIVSIYLKEGEHKLKFKANSTIDIDYFRFINSYSDEYITAEDLNKQEVIAETQTNVSIYREFFVSYDGSDDNIGTIDAPFATIQRAKGAVREINDNMDGNIIVNIMPGYYKISETLDFDENDSGKNGYNVIWRGYNILEKPTVSGGIKITGWQKQDNGIYKTTANSISDIRSLWVNDFMEKRAVSKYTYQPVKKTEAGDGLIVSVKNFPKLYKPENAETVWELYWLVLHLPIRDIIYSDSEAHIIFDEEPWARNAMKSNKSTAASEKGTFSLENDLSLLDEYGEWYFDKETKEIYYFPFPEENMEEAEIFVSPLETLMRVEGSSNTKRAENISFENIAFKHSDWISANTKGVIANQDNQIVSETTGSDLGGDITPAQIQINNAKSINFSGCEFRCMGSGAMSMINSVSDCKIIGNIFADLGGSSIILGSFNHKNVMSEGIDRTVNIEFANNVLRRTSNNIKGSCGISVYYTNGVNIHNNDIKETPYSGITMGWGWEAEDIVATGNHRIANNRIEDVMQVCADGGQIYTLGPLRNTEITGNYCIDSRDENGGIYLDQGSAYINVTNNVVQDSVLWLNARANAGIINIMADGNYTDTDNNNVSSDVKISNTMKFTSDNIPDGAKKIMSEAGLQNKYKNLLNGIERPEWRTNLNRMCTDDLYIGEGIGVQAENYMEGGQDKSWHKEGGRVIRVVSGGISQPLTHTNGGEWMDYEVYVRKSGEYIPQIYYSNLFLDPVSKTRLYIDGKLVSKCENPRTQNWSTYVLADMEKVYIEEGLHIMRIEFVDNAYSFDWWRLYDESTASFENDPYYDEGVIIIPPKKKEFMDIKGHWAEKYIITLASNGVINGVSETEFAPENPVTLYQANWLIMRALGIEYDESDWKETACSKGLLASPDEQDAIISRERFASSVSCAYLQFADSYSMNYVKNPFSDTDLISPYFKEGVINAYALGFVKGDNNKMFNPHSGLTRAEAAAVIYNLNNK